MADEPARVESVNDRFAVLDVFGVKLEVSNPRLAELLTMDAKDALTTDVRELGSSRDVMDLRDEAAQAVPDVVVAPPTARDDLEAHQRMERRARTAAIGSALGFDTSPDGLWHSPAGISILTRTVDGALSLAAAIHFVTEIAARREQIAGADASVLFIVDGEQTVDVFRVAIRQRRLYDVMRVISFENLDEVRRLFAAGAIDHSKAVVLLAPAADIDVGDILSVIRAASEGETDRDLA